MDFADSLWTNFASLFGITVVDANMVHDFVSKKILLCVIFLTGSVFFYAYQAQLTSALAVPSSKLPFTSPEDLLSTDYR